MRITKELEDRIYKKVVETVNKINENYGLHLAIPPIYYDITGVVAGKAKYSSMSIHLNPTLLLQNIEDSVNNTVPHEVCHLGVFQKSRESGKPVAKAHGAEWKRMMWIVGASAKVTHSYDVEDVKKKMTEYHYSCNCKDGHVVSKALHNKIQKGSRRKCLKCNTIIHSWKRVMKIGFSRPSPNGTTFTRESIHEEAN